MTTTTQFDFAAFRRAYERLDSSSLGEVMAADVEYTEIDSRTPPSSPNVIRGLDELRGLIDELATRNLDIEVRDEIVAGDGFSFTAECRYPDGKRVLGMVRGHLNDGKVVRMLEVQAFDE